MTFGATTWPPWGTVSNSVTVAAAPEEKSRHSTPPSSAAMAFSACQTVGLPLRM